MLRCLPHAFLIAFSFVLLGCGDKGAQTESLTVDWDQTVDFTQFQTFSVVTRQIIEGNPDLSQPLPPDAEAAIAQINALIVDAMGPTGLGYEYIPPDEVTPENQPDLWAGNVGAVTEEQGVVYDCIGGWWWGYWGWYWDPCAWIVPRIIDFDVGSLLIPVGSSATQEPIFWGLARGIDYVGADNEERIRNAVTAIFAQWPPDQTGLGGGGMGGMGGAGGMGGSAQ
ncbi:MAG: DUF4136 domain-containing protein [Myxococcales bacterium]|nr:DUF4136 domain-containing protein [Myxococcales bacterium]MDH3485277.1 DUF4136 domain-containing protein [Myxococcales bacterium]